MELLSLESRPAIANPEVTVVSMEGELGPSTATKFESYLRKTINQKEPKVVLNMKKVIYISGVGFGSLLSVKHEVQKNNGGLTIVQLSPDIYESFKILNFQGMFLILKTEEEAVKAFNPSDRKLSPALSKGLGGAKVI